MDLDLGDIMTYGGSDNPGWVKARNTDGLKGLVPFDYLKVIV